jgi:hypothetical protein
MAEISPMSARKRGTRSAHHAWTISLELPSAYGIEGEHYDHESGSTRIQPHLAVKAAGKKGCGPEENDHGDENREAPSGSLDAINLARSDLLHNFTS